MDTAYRIMFITGVLYTFVSLILSGISGAFHFGHAGHFDIGGHGHSGHIDTGGMHNGGLHHGHGVYDAGHSGMHHSASAHNADMHGDIEGHAGSHSLLSGVMVLINPVVAVSFLTVTGGLGILGGEYYKWPDLNTLAIAVCAGVITSFVLYRFVAIPLYKSENSSEVSKKDLVNKEAEVISKIVQDGFGEIRYTANSIKYTGPAKHVSGKTVEQGKTVVIYKIENSVFYVFEKDDYER